MSDYPSPRLVPTAHTVRPGRALPIDLRVDNPADDDLRGATAEVTLEVERGVLVSWRLQLVEVPARTTVEDAMAASEPAWELPLNVAAGTGQFVVTLYAADGAWLNEDRLELPVSTS